MTSVAVDEPSEKVDILALESGGRPKVNHLKGKEVNVIIAVDVLLIGLFTFSPMFLQKLHLQRQQ